MNNIEDRLRDAYEGAADTVRPDSIRRLDEQSVTLHPSRSAQSRPAPRRILIPLSAAASVALVGVLAAVLAGARGHTGHNPSQPPLTGSPAGRFLVAISGPGKRSLTVHNKSTGASVATIAAPRHGMVFTALATGDGRYYLAALRREGACRTWLYQFRLSAAGHPGDWTRYPLGSVDQLVGSIAVSGDNTTLAYHGERCAGSGAGSSDLSVFQVPSQATRSWNIPSQVNVASLSLTAHGRDLSYSFGPAKGFSSGAYVLATSSASGPALQRSHEVAAGPALGRHSAIYSDAITPDGADVYFISGGTGHAYGQGWELGMVSLATGKINVVGRFQGIPGHLMPGPAVRRALVVVRATAPAPTPVPSSNAGPPAPSPTASPGSGTDQPVPSTAPSTSSTANPTASASPSRSPATPAQPAAGTAQPTPSASPTASPHAGQLELIRLPRVPSRSAPAALILSTAPWTRTGVLFAW